MIQQFIKDISAEWQMNVEYCRECSSLKKKHSYEEITEKYYDYKNLFFATGIKDITKNRSASNINKINRITIDIDFRKQHKIESWLDISDEEIIWVWKDLWNFLKSEYPNDYWQWSYIVFSWNGIHIHYIGNIYDIQNEFDYDLYRETCLDFYKTYNSIIWDKELFADEKVWDLWHLFRLPWTINEKWWTEHKCEIILYQDIKSDIVNNMPLLLKLANNRIKKKQEEYILKQKANEIKTKNINAINPFEWINKNIPVEEIIQILIPERRLKSDWKNFNNPNKPWNINASYFVDKDNNILIRNWSTKLPWVKEWFNPVSLVMDWFWFWWKDCLEWFVNNKFISKDILYSNNK